MNWRGGGGQTTNNGGMGSLSPEQSASLTSQTKSTYSLSNLSTVGTYCREVVDLRQGRSRMKTIETICLPCIAKSMERKVFIPVSNKSVFYQTAAYILLTRPQEKYGSVKDVIYNSEC